MSEMKAFLKSIHIENFRSLRDVTLPFKPLTVLVGPNASGKSNALKALDVLSKLMTDEKLPPVSEIQSHLWAGGASQINFQLDTQVEEKQTVYQLELKAEADNPFATEELLVHGVKVISIQDGDGVVQDEDGKNETRYKSNKLALRSAGDYGDKPITSALTEFMKGWEVYNPRPDLIRRMLEKSSSDDDSLLSEALLFWHEHDPDRFRNVSDSLEAATNFRMDRRTIDGVDQPRLLEGYKNPIPLADASDGTLRLVMYNVLLNDPRLPPLNAIEEPEHNLHPGALKDLAKILRQMAERSQVIITTHSSQLLDAFSSESLSDFLGVLLLRNVPGRGTEVLNLEEIRKDRAALDGWMTDFGIGSAIFESELLQDLLEEE